MHRGVATFTLDTGRCPPWLFRRMVKLGRAITQAIVAEYGADEFVRRLGDPVWFQTLGTVLAFDWNASGLTTILTAALKEALRDCERELGVFICGGKGKTSRKTPSEIEAWTNQLSLPSDTGAHLVTTSKMVAKVDSSLIQDGYQLYHHSFIFSPSGAWTVVQQGMNTALGSARRYHWHSAHAADLINEPHSGIASQKMVNRVLNLTARSSEPTRVLSTQLVRQRFASLMRDVRLLDHYRTPVSETVRLDHRGEQLTLLKLEGVEFSAHPVVRESFTAHPYLQKILWKLTDSQPKDYLSLLGTQGVGPKTIRALALVAEVIYGAKPSYLDPARYSFAHGGKDGTPYPVDRLTYDQSIRFFERIVSRLRGLDTDREQILRRLAATARA